jgi:hypothetical protein
MGLLLLLGGSSFSPASLFAAGEQGGWYDPSDFTTLFQNSNGTTAVTAPGDPVGYIADKSGRGNHRTQSTSGSRPLLARLPDGIRRNILLQTESFDSASWTKASGATAIGNVVTYVNADSRVQQNISGIGTPATLTIRMIASVASGTTTLKMRLADANDGTPSSTANCSLTTTPTVFTNTATLSTGFSGNLAVLLFGDGVIAPGSVVTINELQVELASSASAYQKVTTAADVTESGKTDRWCLLYDTAGTWFHQTGNVNFGTDKVTVFSAVRKVSDAARQTVVELTASSASNNGAFHLTAPNAASDTFAFESKGTSLTDAVATGIAAPATRILTGIGDIAGDTTTLRVNGVQADTDAGDQGTGNYSTAALYFGARGGSTLPFGGYEFGTIVRGAETTAATIQQVERWLAAKAGVTL